jgi:putative acyl-CoA dehydrogenase
VTKRAVAGVAEAMECLGGNGYVEDSGLPRLYRDVPVNAIWEGSGNVQCLDVLRALAREPEALDAYRAELLLARGADRRYDAYLERLDRDLAALANGDPQALARRITERLALVLQAALLLRHAPTPVAEVFCAGRLDGSGHAFGTLPAGLDCAAVVERARPR